MDWMLEVVTVPVSDVDRAKQFYAEQLGFGVDHDTRISDTARIVQVTPPGSGCSLVLADGLVEMAPGSLQGLQLVVADIEEAHSTLVDHGVDVSEVEHFEGSERKPGHGGPWNAFLFFADPDGNSWTIQERAPQG